MKKKIEKINYLIGIMGKTGTGKTELVKKALKNIRSYIIIDPMNEYTQGVIFEETDEVLAFIDKWKQPKIIYRPKNNEDHEQFFDRVIKRKNDYTLVLEEADFWCSPHRIDPVLFNLIRYGRHTRRSLIWVSRNPVEVSRHLTRLSHLIITFIQTEPIDLKYFRSCGTFNLQIDKLGEFEWAYWCSTVNKHREAELLNLFKDKNFLPAKATGETEASSSKTE